MARKQTCKKVYIRADGSESRSAHPDVTRLELRIMDSDGENVVETIAIESADLPAPMGLCAMFHGIGQKIGDTVTTAKSKGDDYIDAGLSMWEAIKGGEWVKEGESAGPRTTYLLDAIMAVVVNSKGPDADTPEMRARVAESIKTTEQKRAAQKDPRVKAELEAIKLKAQQERAKAAAKAAKEGDESAPSVLDGLGLES